MESNKKMSEEMKGYVYKNLARAYYELGDFDKCEQYNLLAFDNLLKVKYDEAIECVNIVKSLRADNSYRLEIRRNLIGDIFYKNGFYNESVESYQSYNIYAAKAYIMLDRYDEAIDILNNLYYSNLDIVLCYLCIERYDKALEQTTEYDNLVKYCKKNKYGKLVDFYTELLSDNKLDKCQIHMFELLISKTIRAKDRECCLFL